MHRAKKCALLAAAAAVTLASAALAAPPENEGSYLPPQSSRPQQITRNEKAIVQRAWRPQRRVRTRTRSRRMAGEYQPDPPVMPFFLDMLFFPFF